MAVELKDLPDQDGFWWQVIGGKIIDCLEVEIGNWGALLVKCRNGKKELFSSRGGQWVKAEPPVIHPLDLQLPEKATRFEARHFSGTELFGLFTHGMFHYINYVGGSGTIAPSRAKESFHDFRWV